MLESITTPLTMYTSTTEHTSGIVKVTDVKRGREDKERQGGQADTRPICFPALGEEVKGMKSEK